MVATNIAQMSITIDGILYVVDSCFVKQVWFSPKTHCDSDSQQAGQVSQDVQVLHLHPH